MCVYIYVHVYITGVSAEILKNSAVYSIYQTTRPSSCVFSNLFGDHSHFMRVCVCVCVCVCVYICTYVQTRRLVRNIRKVSCLLYVPDNMTIKLSFQKSIWRSREVGGWGRVPFSRNSMSHTPRRKWYLTTGRRFH